MIKFDGRFGVFITLCSFATAVIANAIVAVTHTRYFRFSPKIPFLFRTTFGVRLRSRLERIFCVLLRLSERSGTIEVHLATLSA